MQAASSCDEGMFQGYAMAYAVIILFYFYPK
jgi:hypothetical protein